MESQFLISRPGHIYLASYHRATNEFRIRHDLKIPGCPSWLALDQGRSLLYVVDEDSTQFHRMKLDVSLDPPFGPLTTVADASAGAVYLTFSQDGNKLVGAAFGSSKVDVWNIADGVHFQKMHEKTVVSDGSLGPVSHIQDGPHPHQVLLEPTGRFYVVNDLGTDEVLVIDSENDKFTVCNRISVAPGGGPRHGAFYPVGAVRATHYILLCELANTVVVYALEYTENNMNFAKISEACTFGPLGPSIASARAGHLELLPDNNNLYVTNRLTERGTDSIVHFSISELDGHPVLNFESEVATRGILPRMFCVMDGGRGDIIVANELSSCGLAIFERNEKTGRLAEEPKLLVPMSEFMGEEEMRETPGNGPKFIMEL